jgi:hypothetical protein
VVSLVPWPGSDGTVSGQRPLAPAGAVAARPHPPRERYVAVRRPSLPAVSPARATRRRDGFVAGALGALVPGLGHVYAGEPWRGLAVFAVTEGGLVTALKSDDRYVRATAGSLGFGAYLYGIMDAPAAADRYNRRHTERAVQ